MVLWIELFNYLFNQSFGIDLSPRSNEILLCDILDCLIEIIEDFNLIIYLKKLYEN
jgi:hypothetical protein